MSLELAMESNKRKRANHRRGTETSETVSATRAQNEFGRLLERATAGERVMITRHNRPAAVLIPANDYAGLDDPVSEIEGGLDSDVAIRLDKLSNG